MESQNREVNVAHSETSSQAHNVSSGSMSCELFNFYREVVAKGKTSRESIFSEGEDQMQFYRIRLSVIVDPEERLFVSKMKLGELVPPLTIKWPSQFTRFV